MPAVTYEIGADNTKLRHSLKEAKGEVASLRASVQKEAAELKNSGGLLGGFGAALGAIGGVAMLKGIADGIGDLVDTSDQLEIPIETLDRLSKAMMGSGVSSENIRKSLLALNAVRQAAMQGDTAARAKLEALGISMARLSETDLQGTFMDVADGLKATENASLRAALAVDVLGTKQAKMIGAMKGGSEALKAQMAGVNAITDAEAHQIDDAADDAVAKLEAAKTSIAKGVVAVGESVGYIAANIAQAASRAMGGGGPGEITQEQSDSLAAKYADAGDKQQSASKKAADAERKKHEEKMLNIAKEKAAALDQKDIEESNKQESKSNIDRANALRENFSLTQKWAESVSRVKRARDDLNSAEKTGNQSDIYAARAALAKEKSDAEPNRAAMVNRFSGSHQDMLNRVRDEKKSMRAQAAAERKFAQYERQAFDRADRAKESFDEHVNHLGEGAKRMGDITKQRGGNWVDDKESRRKASEQLKKDLRVDDHGMMGRDDIPGKTLQSIQDINKTLTAFGQKIQLIK